MQSHVVAISGIGKSYNPLPAPKSFGWPVNSAVPPKADIAERDWHVRFVPKADILRRIEERPSSIASPTAQLGCTGLC